MTETTTDMKVKTSLQELCKGLPKEFISYLEYCKNLKFDEAPDYNYLRSLFTTIMTQKNLKNDGNYDWLLKRDGRTDTVVK